MESTLLHRHPKASLVVALSLTLSGCGESRLHADFDGLGSVRIGFTVDELSEALGKSVTLPTDPEDQGCFYVPGDADSSYSFMVVGGSVARVDIDTPEIPTQLGARVGDSLDRVRQLYGAALEEAPHKYTGPRDLYLTVWSPDRASALRFETSDGKVSRFYVGRASEVQYVEGCL